MSLNRDATYDEGGKGKKGIMNARAVERIAPSARSRIRPAALYSLYSVRDGILLTSQGHRSVLCSGDGKAI